MDISFVHGPFFTPPPTPKLATLKGTFLRFLSPIILLSSFTVPVVINAIITKKIKINGMVQGVGFRPHVYRLATKNGLCGEIANTLAGIELILQGDEAKIALLLKSLQTSPPPGSVINSASEQVISTNRYPTFTIGPSLPGGTMAPLAPADFGMCPECETELLDPDNRRFQHPFISCTACGPRFSLLHGLPYDRRLTTMMEFPLCPLCQKEYDDPGSRRFHAEPICCPNCGPQLVFYDKNGMETNNPLQKTAALLNKGKVVAIKGVGGFHLAADACNPEAVARLRTIKRRPDKPLAIMVRDLATAATLVHVSRKAADLLCSSPRPIVILPLKSETSLAEQIAPGLAEVGIMLAYTPLHYLLFDLAHPVLVMTSFNEPGSPMLTSTTEALKRLGTACDAVLSHQRKIVNRCDDSVFRMHTDQAQMLRRSRGYAPLPVTLSKESPSILACGAGEKMTICLTRSTMAFFSQHLGETRSPAGQHAYRQAASHLQSLLHITPQLIAHDLHPDYYSSRFALSHPGVEKIDVQHHHAHIASCMVENNIDRPVLGLALDGTGLGPDGTLWGGEILLCTLSDFRRLAHFVPLAMPGAESAIREPWRLALAWLHREGLPHRELAFLRKTSNSSKEMVIQMLDGQVNCPLTSSLGRLFDAAAALIDLRGLITFSAQAAMELEAISDPHEQGTYPFSTNQGQAGAPYVMETTGLLQGIVEDVDKGTGQGIIAARFHNTIIAMLADTCIIVAREQAIEEVACSGGVFQNRIISLGLQTALEKAGLTVHCHHNIPCNDGGLALGQAAVAAALYKKRQQPTDSLAGTRNA